MVPPHPSTPQSQSCSAVPVYALLTRTYINKKFHRIRVANSRRHRGGVVVEVQDFGRTAVLVIVVGLRPGQETVEGVESPVGGHELRLVEPEVPFTDHASSVASRGEGNT